MLVDIPFTRHRLENNIEVIFHEDHSLPLVVLNINVQVGSRDERAGRTGFAHLFEHLMFMGTRRVPEKKFDDWMEKEGGWNNAWTSTDRTNYFDVGPSHSLPLLLWMEADRFSSLGAEMTQDKLDAQRGVVRNERRQQIENAPYGEVELRLPAIMSPKGFPYHHPVIGSHEDLKAASVDDVKRFFSQWYVAGNISIVVAGDIDPAKAKDEVEKTFGALPKMSPPVRNSPAPLPALPEVHRETLTDDVTLPKLVMAWRSPAAYAQGDAALDVVADVLSSGKASHLYKALVYDHQLAQSVSAYQMSRTLGSIFVIEAVARPGVSLDTIEASIDGVVRKLQQEGPSPGEVERTKNQYEASFIARLQSLSTRASILNGYYAAKRDPGWIANDLKRYLDLTPTDIKEAARVYLPLNKRAIVSVVPKDTP